MKETQQEINNFLLEKNINEASISRLIAANPKSKLSDDKERCPRCYSDKIRRNSVEWTNTAYGSGYGDEIAALDGISGRATYKDEVVCNVCGKWLADPNNEKGKSIWRTLWDIITDNPLGI